CPLVTEWPRQVSHSSPHACIPWYRAGLFLSRRGNITSTRVDRNGPPAIFRRLRHRPSGLVPEGPCGGTGRRALLQIELRKECWFDSGQGHQPSQLRLARPVLAHARPIISLRSSRPDPFDDGGEARSLFGIADLLHAAFEVAEHAVHLPRRLSFRHDLV